MSSRREVIDMVRREVELRFHVRQAFAIHGGLGFFVDSPLDLEESFESLRRALRPMGMVVSIDEQPGKTTVYVANLPLTSTRPVMVNKIMLLVTFITTVISGSLLWAGHSGSGGILSPDNLLWGAISFAAPLLLILGVHELSHYFMARRHGLAVSFPFFIPSIPPVGTFGAFISIREPLPNRKSLVDVGLSGPFGGFIVAIPVLVIGYFLSSGDSSSILQEGMVTYFGMPLIMQGLLHFFPVSGNLFMHPTMFAGWLGLFITGINLLPAGQLDGGHVSRAVLGKRSIYLGYAVMATLVLLSTVYTGWLIFAFLILMLGVSHPPPLNDVTPLDRKRYVAAGLGLVLLVTCFIPIPMEARVYEASLSWSSEGSVNLELAPGDWGEFTFYLENDGDVPLTVDVSLRGLPTGWDHQLGISGGDPPVPGPLSVDLEKGETVKLLLRIEVDSSATPEGHGMALRAVGGSATESIGLSITVV